MTLHDHTSLRLSMDGKLVGFHDSLVNRKRYVTARQAKRIK